MDPKAAKNKLIIEGFKKETKQFYEFHGVQMVGSNFPVELVETIHNKLKHEVYDGGDHLEIVDTEECFLVNAKHPLNCSTNVFLIDHALTFRYVDLYPLLKSNPKVLPRLKLMLKYHQNKKPLHPEPKEENPLELQFQSIGLTEITHLNFSPNIITLSLIGNNLTNAQEIMKKLQYLNLKALWLNDNPVEHNVELRQFVTSRTKIQLYNSEFTTNCTEWGLKFVQKNDISFATQTVSQHIYILNLKNRNIFNVPLPIFTKFTNLRLLNLHGHSFQSQANKLHLFTLLNSLPSLKQLLLDEQWQLAIDFSEFTPKLKINKHSMGHVQKNDNQIESIMENIPKIAGCYRLANTVQLDQTSCWYINDELGSMLSHSDSPNAKLAPFLYAPNRAMDASVQAFSVLWFLRDIGEGQSISVDWLHGYSEEKQRGFRLAIWYTLQRDTMEDISKKYDQMMSERTRSSLAVIQKFYEVNSTRQKEAAAEFYSKPLPQKYTVSTDYEYIRKYLKHPKFEVVESQGEILWMTEAADEKQWKAIRGKHILNQFPYEACVVMKHNLAHTIQSIFGDTTYLMRTYDLELELGAFIAQYERRASHGMDNLWIMKPPNMARSMDMIITDNLSLIIKMMETGPKIAQKYISNPVLREGRKIDLRYVLLVRSVQPLVLFLYKHFWVRSANHPYTTDSRHLAKYQTQFTVMNYGAVSDFKQISHQSFQDMFEKDYAPNKWTTIHDKIKKMLRNVFIAAATKHPEMHDSHSRALYGIDVMIDADSFEPKLLEITFSPDCKRACEYYPSFYDDVFETLFLNGMPQSMERII